MFFSAAASASAISPALNFSSALPNHYNGQDRLLGFQFTVGANDITVDQLGTYDQNQDGLISSHGVGIWETSSQNLVASTTVPAGTTATLEGLYRYSALSTPVTLNAGQTYRIAAQYFNGGDAYNWGSPNDLGVLTIVPDMTIDGGAYSSSGVALEYPTSGNSNLFSVNFSTGFASVPFEFSPTLGLVAVGSIFGVSRLRKQIATSKAINKISA